MADLYRIATIVEQMGGLGTHGAIAYVGGHKLAGYDLNPKSTPDRCKFKDGMPIENEHACWLRFAVNGKPGEDWLMYISLEPSDTYTLRLTAQVDGKRQILEMMEDLYCDNLQRAVEELYDDMLKTRNGGWLPLD